jgi:hypothetical protein
VRRTLRHPSFANRAINTVTRRVRAGLTGNQSIGAATWTTIEYNDVVQNDNGDFDSSTYTWTCPGDGWYSFYIGVVFDATEAVSLRINSASEGLVNFMWADTTAVSAVSVVRFVPAGQDMYFQVYTASDSTITDVGRTVLNICRLGF